MKIPILCVMRYILEDDKLFILVTCMGLYRIDTTLLNEIIVDDKHYYEVELVKDYGNGQYLYHVIDYKGHWFDRNIDD